MANYFAAINKTLDNPNVEPSFKERNHSDFVPKETSVECKISTFTVVIIRAGPLLLIAPRLKFAFINFICGTMRYTYP